MTAWATNEPNDFGFGEANDENAGHVDAARMGLVRDALADGTDRARKAARTTMELVREALDLGYLEKFRGQ